MATYQGRSGVFSVIVDPSGLSGGKQFFNATIVPSGVNFFLVSLGVGEVMSATLVNQGPQTSVTLANAEWRFQTTQRAACCTRNAESPTILSTYASAIMCRIDWQCLFGSSPTQICVAIFDPRLLTDPTTQPWDWNTNDWNPPTASVNYIITFGFSGSGTAVPQ